MHNESTKYYPPSLPNSESNIPILHKLTDAYLSWHESLRNMQKLSRYTLGVRIDNLYLETVEIILFAAYAKKEQKLVAVQRASTKFDALNFFLQIAWQAKAIDQKTYIRISAPLEEVGKMLGGWEKHLRKDPP